MTIERPTKWVVVRSGQSGVWLGRLESYQYDTRTVVLLDARRAWNWEGAASCSGLAVQGPSGGKMPSAVSRAIIADVCEVLDATDTAVKRWQRVAEWTE